jgi:High potential iron-sulfur protein
MRGSSSRRDLLKSFAAGAAVALMAGRDVPAAEAQKLDPKDPAARALGYVEDAAQVDLKKYPAFVKGSSCENCLLLEGTAGSRFRPCSAFAEKLVSVAGWCASWTPEM